MSKRMTQAEMVLALLKEKPITRTDAVVDLGCFELSARIGELERAGHIIHHEKKTGVNRFGVSVRYVRYSLASEATA